MMYHYSDQRRNDPELNEKVRLVVEAQSAELLKAAAALKEIFDSMRKLSGFVDCAIYTRCFEAVRMAHYKVNSDAEFMDGLPNDTYIGNKSASELGEQIEAMGDDFYKYFPKNVQND